MTIFVWLDFRLLVRSKHSSLLFSRLLSWPVPRASDFPAPTLWGELHLFYSPTFTTMEVGQSDNTSVEKQDQEWKRMMRLLKKSAPKGKRIKRNKVKRPMGVVFVDEELTEEQKEQRRKKEMARREELQERLKREAERKLQKKKKIKL
ncbi:uncharacterized protein LOC114575501 [Exaiptasia diaphana]|uniref:Uncharacterized protein n=1 Tax=Exaiptasia diaphana TaxID=2652724 RepID=A0A913YP54_EXADI|nr:uncharacterized protein LOC114575501 [Exaiptasia diaphana]